MSSNTSPNSRFSWILWSCGSNLGAFYPLTWLKVNEITWKFSQKSPLLSFITYLRIKIIYYISKSSIPPDDGIRAEITSFCLNSSFMKFPIASEISFLEGHKRDPKARDILKQFFNFFKNFKSPWLSRVKEMPLLT